ncbi:MAG: 2Fe-2S iron-sulfur cluster-binding protein [Hyphomicrobiaceae bacterium]
MLESGNEVADEMSRDIASTSVPAAKPKLQVRVARITQEAEGIRAFELVSLVGDLLPPFTAGAHIEVHIEPGVIRSYSLSSDPADRSHYEIAVLREEGGRGGSRFMHDRVREGDVLTISEPKNHFPLAGREARVHLLVAGGIGVTPMMAMIAELERKGARWHMHYLTRNSGRTAFRLRLAPLIAAGKVTLHHDNGDPQSGPGVASLLSDFEIGTHLYYCGPPGFMTACSNALEAWPPHAIHREYFAAPVGVDHGENTAFEIKLKSTGQTLSVPAEKSIVEVLAEAGVIVETDCKDGYCGTCITRYVSGQPEHRDTVLSEKERKSYVMVCCARARSGVLELDL